MGQEQIAPHKGRELEMVLNGTKPLASFDFNEDPQGYTQVMESRDVKLCVRVHSTTLITVSLRKNKKLHDTYELLMSSQAAVLVHSKEDKQTLLGRLFGYTEEEIAAFIKADLGCACGQCAWDNK